MKPVLFLRIASVLTLLHAVLHTIGGVFGKQLPGPQQVAVLAMKTNLFPMMGMTRSFWDFYLGMGLAVSVLLTVEAVVFWQLASLARTHAWQIRPILATFVLGYLALAVTSYEFFFVPPVIVEILIALCLGLAMFTSRSTASTEAR